MPTKPLYDKTIKQLDPAKGERITIFDSVTRDALRKEKLSGGLCIRAGERSRIFYVIHYEGGRPKYHKLERYPKMSLADARNAATAFLRNPQAAIEAANAGTFKEIAEDFLARYVRKKGLRSEFEIVRLLNTCIYPRWKDKRFLEIRRGDVTKLLDRIEDENGARQADNCLAILRKMTNWYETRHDNYRSPIIRGMARKSTAESARTRILSDDEIRSLWKACDESGAFGALLKICLLTAQRNGKVKAMKWADVDDDGVWNIPTEAREKGNAGAMKLPALALQIVRSQPRLKDNSYVFAAPSSGKPLDNFSRGKTLIDSKMPEETEHWVIHDLRRTARSLMARAGILPHVAERVLGHKLAGVEGVYDRHTYDDEKALALEKLAALVEQILNPPKGNVVALRP